MSCRLIKLKLLLSTYTKLSLRSYLLKNSISGNSAQQRRCLTAIVDALGRSRLMLAYNSLREAVEESIVFASKCWQISARSKLHWNSKTTHNAIARTTFSYNRIPIMHMHKVYYSDTSRFPEVCQTVGSRFIRHINCKDGIRQFKDSTKLHNWCCDISWNSNPRQNVCET